MFSIKEERNTSYVVLWPFKFVLTSVKFQMSGHQDIDNRKKANNQIELKVLFNK